MFSNKYLSSTFRRKWLEKYILIYLDNSLKIHVLFLGYDVPTDVISRTPSLQTGKPTPTP